MLHTKEDKKNVSPLAAGVAGAVVGAGIAVAGAVALKDEKNRVKVKGVIKKVKNQAVKYVGKVQDEVNNHERIAKKK